MDDLPGWLHVLLLIFWWPSLWKSYASHVVILKLWRAHTNLSESCLERQKRSSSLGPIMILHDLLGGCSNLGTPPPWALGWSTWLTSRLAAYLLVAFFVEVLRKSRSHLEAVARPHQPFRVLSGATKKEQQPGANHIYYILYFGLSPLPVRVTTRIITCLVGNPYKPSFPLLLGGGTTQIILNYI